MTREQAKQIALKEVERQIEQHGENAVAFRAPQCGKNIWTWGEYKTAILNDECLENSNFNPIDGVLRLHKHFINKGKKGLK